MGPMPRATSNGIELEYQMFGDPSNPALLLVNGLGGQMIGWDDEFCELLAGRGFRGIRFDNRDVGLSTWTDAPYTLEDTAAHPPRLPDAPGLSPAPLLALPLSASTP